MHGGAIGAALGTVLPSASRCFIGLGVSLTGQLGAAICNSICEDQCPDPPINPMCAVPSVLLGAALGCWRGAFFDNVKHELEERAVQLILSVIQGQLGSICGHGARLEHGLR